MLPFLLPIGSRLLFLRLLLYFKNSQTMDKFIEYSLRFNRKKRLDINDNAPIEVRMYLNGIASYKGTGISITPNGWNKAKNRPKDNFINRKCETIISELKVFELDFRQKNGTFTMKDFKVLHKPKTVPEPTNLSFIKFVAEQLQAEKSENIVSLRSRKLSFEYLKQLRHELAFNEIDFQIIRDFDFFLKSKNLHTNTILKHHNHFKKYIKLAIKSHLISCNPYDDFKIPKAEAYSSFCTAEELQRLENLTFDVKDRKEQFRERCRDMFLFSSYTGLRYSDTEKITAKHFQNSKEGLTLDYQANKTKKFGKKYLFALFGGKPERIALKYMPKNDDTLFKGMPQQRVNETLKVLAERAGITKILRFKDSRNTFAVYLLTKNIPMNIVQSEMQHKNLSTTQIYLKHTPDMVIKAFKNTKW